MTVITGVGVALARIAKTSLTVVAIAACNADVASPAGGNRSAASAPMPGAPAGALIGRIGNGPAFAIGNLTKVTMPSSGRFYLGVNDDELSDNSGAYQVVLSPSPTLR